MDHDYLPATASVSLKIDINTEELLQIFFAEKSLKTIEAYKRDLEDLRKFLEVESMEQVARTFLSGSLQNANYIALKFKQRLVEIKRLQPTTVNRQLAALRSLGDMAYTIGIINWKVRVKNQKISSALRDTRGPQRTGINKLQEELFKRTDAKGERDTAIFHLLYDLALRRSEVVGLDLEDIDLERGFLHVQGRIAELVAG